MHVGRYGHWIVFSRGDEQFCWDHNPKSASNSELKGGLKPQASGRYTKGAGGLRGHQPQRWAQMRLALWANQNRLKVLDPQTRFLDCWVLQMTNFAGSSLCLSFNPFPLRTKSTVYHRFPHWICFSVSPTISRWNPLFLLVDSIDSSIFAGCFSPISLLHRRIKQSDSDPWADQQEPYPIDTPKLKMVYTGLSYCWACHIINPVPILGIPP